MTELVMAILILAAMWISFQIGYSAGKRRVCEMLTLPGVAERLPEMVKRAINRSKEL